MSNAVRDNPARNRYELELEGGTAGGTVIPSWPFIAAYMRKHPEYQDLR